ncbi:MAG TPA: ADOP family duplicated permease [Vicinamibacterales bacterium]|nr:ADOP family duplicated permease [Vicinamibacterales bacterium]
MRDWNAYVRAHLALPGFTPTRQARIVRELADQLEDFHREGIARGLTEAESDAFARRQIGDWDRLAQDVWLADRRHARPRLERAALRLEDAAPARSKGFMMLANLLHDARFAVRQYASTPGFTLVALLTLALGIGANTAIFSVVDGVLLRPLPYPEPERLVLVNEIVPQYGSFSVAPANFLDWRRQNTSFERIATFTSSSATLIEGDTPERVVNATVSWDLFDLLRVRPVLGRTFAAGEDAPMKNQVVILSHGMWQRRFGGDPGIVGRQLSLNGTPYEVIGVMPAGFTFPSRDVEYWVPIALDTAQPTRGGHYLAVIARLKEGVALQQARAEMKTIAERLAIEHPDTNRDESAEIIALHDAAVGRVRPALLTLLAAVGVVVLIACANMANLLLVRGSGRGREIAIRTALGAGRRRIALQMLAESVVLAVAGGALGLLLAYLAIPTIQTLGTDSVPRVQDVAIDGRVLAFTLVLCLVTGIVFGVVPAWQASRASVSDVMKEGGRSSTGSGGRWLRNALVTAEVALSLVLLVGASLLLRSFDRLTQVDPGFRAEGVLSFRVSLPPTAYPEDAHRQAFFGQLLERLRALPGVMASGMIQSLPIRGDYVLSFTVQGRPTQPGKDPSANYRVVSPGSFEALGIPVRLGRAFTDRDAAGGPLVAMVDEAFVRRHFPGEDPIGRGIDIGNGTDGFYEIVGVVGDVRYGGLDARANPTMYVPYEQDVFSTMWVVTRTAGNPRDLQGPVRGVVKDLDRGLPAYQMSALSDIVSNSLAERRFSMFLLGLFALVALFLSAVGLYGVISYSVSQRTQEIGLRLAIGAPRGHLLGMVIGQGMRLVVTGIIVGLAGAVALARSVSSLLFEVTPFDPPSYAATALVLVSVAALACYVPARRATRVDPIVALRCE